MTLHRAHVPAKWLAHSKPHSQLALPQEVLHRLTAVVRVSSGELVELFDGEGLCVRGYVRGDRFEVESVEKKSKSGPRMVLAQALVARGKLEDIVQQATQIGADKIVLFTSKNCVTKITERSDEQIERLRRIAVDATRQCERADTPEIAGPIRFADLVASVQTTKAFVGDPREQTHLLGQIDSDAQEITLIVGPEGGLDLVELAALKQAGAKAVRYAPYVLRTEIAGLVGLSIIQSRML